MGVVGELIRVLLSIWVDEADAFGPVLGEGSISSVVHDDVDFGGESRETPGQLDGDAEDKGETEEPVFQTAWLLGKRGETVLSQFLIRGVCSPGSSSLSIVDWRLEMLVIDSEVTKSC